MRNALTGLGLVLLAAVFWGIAGAVDGSRPPRPLPTLVRLFALEEEPPVYAALDLDVPATGESFLYVRTEGRWRCRTAFLAPVLDGAVPQLVQALLAAEGVVRASSGPAHPSYGLDPPRLRIALRGPRALSAEDGDVRAVIELGTTLVDGVARPVTFARRAGDERVLELALDLGTLLDRPPQSSMPPMLDERLVPGAWPTTGGAFRYLRIEGSHGVISLVRRDLDPAELAPGQAPWEWVIQSDQHDTQVCSFTRVETFCAFLMVAPYVGLEDPARASEFVAEPRIVVLGRRVEESEPLELYVGERAPRVRGSFCLNPRDRLLAVAADEVVRALDPEPGRFFDDGRPDPWTPFLGLE